MGLSIKDLPGHARVLYGQLADGTYGVVKVNADGSLTTGDSIQGRTPLGCDQIAATAAVKGLADGPTLGAIPAGATMAIVEPEGADARFRDDGVNPSASVGMRLGDGARLVFSGNLTALKFIAQSGTAKYNISFYK